MPLVAGGASTAPEPKTGELPRGLLVGLEENRNGSGFSLSPGSIHQQQMIVCHVKYLRCTFFSRNVKRPLVSHSLSACPSFSFRNLWTFSRLSAGDSRVSSGWEIVATRGGVENANSALAWTRPGVSGEPRLLLANCESEAQSE